MQCIMSVCCRDGHAIGLVVLSFSGDAGLDAVIMRYDSAGVLLGATISFVSSKQTNAVVTESLSEVESSRVSYHRHPKKGTV
jgi:hypothetical protein